jgi:hypothetical protein
VEAELYKPDEALFAALSSFSAAQSADPVRVWSEAEEPELLAGLLPLGPLQAVFALPPEVA